MGDRKDNPLGVVELRAPYFGDQVEPKGRLLLDRRCHACWYYYMLADKCRVNVGDGPDSQIIVVGEGMPHADWMDKRYHQIAKSVAILYGLESPDDFLPFFEIVEQEANRLGYEVAYELLRPFGIGLNS